MPNMTSAGVPGQFQGHLCSHFIDSNIKSFSKAKKLGERTALRGVKGQRHRKRKQKLLVALQNLGLLDI